MRTDSKEETDSHLLSFCCFKFATVYVKLKHITIPDFLPRFYYNKMIEKQTTVSPDLF